MNSVWWKNVNAPRFPRLEKSICTDVLIIGAGMAGILCAHMLREAGVDCILVEARRICEGTTGNTTAPRCPHLGCALKYNKEEYSWDCSCHGSRFSDSGELLDYPATDDMNK